MIFDEARALQAHADEVAEVEADVRKKLEAAMDALSSLHPERRSRWIYKIEDPKVWAELSSSDHKAFQAELDKFKESWALWCSIRNFLRTKL